MEILSGWFCVELYLRDNVLQSVATHYNMPPSTTVIIGDWQEQSYKKTTFSYRSYSLTIDNPTPWDAQEFAWSLNQWRLTWKDQVMYLYANPLNINPDIWAIRAALPKTDILLLMNKPHENYIIMTNCIADWAMRAKLILSRAVDNIG